MTDDAVRIAYVIVAHRLPRQVARLMGSLARPGTRFYLHIDRKVDIRPFRDAVRDLNPPADVVWLKRESCHWGDFGMAQATLNALNCIAGNPDFDFAILLSGQCYPIKPVAYINRFLRAHLSQSFIEQFPMPTEIWPPDGGMEKVEKYWFWFQGRFWQYPFREPRRSLRGQVINQLFRLRFPLPRRLPADLRLHGGSSWWCLSREALSYTVGFLRRRPDVTRFFRFTRSPDEMLFNSVIASSPLKRTANHSRLVYTDWSRSAGAHPATLAEADLENIARTDHLFARKFDTEQDPEILDLIDARLLAGEGPPVEQNRLLEQGACA